MELMDIFAKADQVLDASCKRNEKVYFEMSKILDKEAKLQIEVERSRGAAKSMPIAEYLRDFRWDQVRFQMDKSLKVLGQKITGTQKQCDDRLKKLVDEQNDIKTKLTHLTKKDSPSLLQKDTGDLVYEQKMPKQSFVNTHGSDLMTTVLVVVPKKKVEQFKGCYWNILLAHYANDFANWEKRTREVIRQHQHAEKQEHKDAEEDEQKESVEDIIEREFDAQAAAHRKLIELPGAVPFSEKFLGYDDPEGNQLWMITCMKE